MSSSVATAIKYCHFIYLPTRENDLRKDKVRPLMK
jgi:hypothetical protein